MQETVDAPVDRLWWAFTTAEGQESWQVAHAKVDLRIDGLMRAHYDREGRIGDENTIHNQILSFDPPRMLSFRIVRPPVHFPFKTTAGDVWTVVYFDPIDAEHTRVTVTMLGWPDTEESRQMRGFFEKGNRWVLDKLKLHFAKPADSAGAL